MSITHSIKFHNSQLHTIRFSPNFRSVLHALLIEMAKELDPTFPSGEFLYKEEEGAGLMDRWKSQWYGNASQGIQHHSHELEPESYYDPGSTTIHLSVYGLENHQLESTYTSNGRAPSFYTFTVSGEIKLTKQQVVIFQRMKMLFTERKGMRTIPIDQEELLNLLLEQ